MNKNLVAGLPSIVFLQSFTVFPEYFISVSIIYVLTVIALITYNVYGLMLQKALSECMALILLMACYLIINDDLMILNVASFNDSIINDYFSFFTKIIICFFSSVYFLFSSNFLKEQKLTSFEYLLIILFAILGLMLMCSSNDLLTAYLSIELSSLAFYILASYKKTSSYSIESGITYFITGAVSSAFFLLGSSFIYGTCGSINFSEFKDFFEDPQSVFFIWWDVLPPAAPGCFEVDQIIRDIIVSKQLQEAGLERVPVPMDIYSQYTFIELGLTLILFSLFIKLALAPFHLWSLDVYEGSPTSSTIFFAVITKLGIFVLLVRLCYTSFFSLSDSWQFYSIWIGIFSIFTGAFGGLKQRKLKTLLAYSSTSHMGYVLIAFGINTFLGFNMFLFYMIIYMISGLCIWFILLMLRLKDDKILNKYNKELSDLSLLKKSNSALAFALSLTMFSIAGIPPMIGFLAKMNVFLSVIGTDFYIIAFASIFFSVISTFYYIRIIKVVYFENLLVGKLYYPINTTKTLIFSILILLLMFLFINPTFLYLYNHKIILSFMVPKVIWYHP